MTHIQRLVIRWITWYQHNISPYFPRRCRYEPTCSSYAVQAIKIHGFTKGLMLAMWRIMRCNPLSNGGVDWVPDRGKWPAKPLGYEELIEFRRSHDES